MRIDVITLFPAIFPGPLGESIPGRVLERGLAELVAHDLRAWGLGRHKSVDDYPYGGGAGMILRPEPIAAALQAVAPVGSGAYRILLDPGGERFEQARAVDLSQRDHLVFVCPRYEGVDDRVRSMVDLELSVGDYVVSGGEIPAPSTWRRVGRIGFASCTSARTTRSASLCWTGRLRSPGRLWPRTAPTCPSISG